ncbi:hypothetical protein D3C78_1860200 [compost metagenome]
MLDDLEVEEGRLLHVDDGTMRIVVTPGRHLANGVVDVGERPPLHHAGRKKMLRKLDRLSLGRLCKLILDSVE